jgi:hypothetical protein
MSRLPNRSAEVCIAGVTSGGRTVLKNLDQIPDRKVSGKPDVARFALQSQFEGTKEFLMLGAADVQIAKQSVTVANLAPTGAGEDFPYDGSWRGGLGHGITNPNFSTW